MEEQHLSLDRHLRELESSAQRWADTDTDTGSAADRDSVVDAAELLLPPLHEHLDLEEEKVLPLIDAYLSQKEWDGRRGYASYGTATPPHYAG
jgi:hemerythrin-like domain-containing protein